MIVTPTVAELRRHINWSFFFSGWGVPGRYPDIFADPAKGETARGLYADAQSMLDVMDAASCYRPAGVIASIKAHAKGDDVLLSLDDGETRFLPMLRNEQTGECVADFIDRSGNLVRLFALSAGFGLKELIDTFGGDDYNAFMAKMLADRLTEAMADMYLPGGCRLAVGYPSIPDHSLKRDVLEILADNAGGADDAQGYPLGFTLTESCMIVPAETVCGLWVSSGRFFDIGAVSERQLHSYALRRGIPAGDLRRFISGLA